METKNDLGAAFDYQARVARIDCAALECQLAGAESLRARLLSGEPTRSIMRVERAPANWAGEQTVR